jgi:hypothetical protein
MKSIPKTAILVLVYLTTSCANHKKLAQKTVEKPLEQYVPKDIKTTIAVNYLGSYYKGNFVWCGAMNLAWNVLNENIIKGKVKLKSEEKATLEMVNSLNNSTFTKKDLDSSSYYIKSGFGQKTVDAINKESKTKFPDKSLEDLKLQLENDDIISYSYFNKSVSYRYEFDKASVTFKGKKVKGFAYNPRISDQNFNIEVIEYVNDDQFIARLKLKENNTEMIVAKGYNRNNPAVVIEKWNNSNPSDYYSLQEADELEAPILNLNFHREYKEVTNKFLENKEFESKYFSQMFENIKFKMDEKGAVVEAEAVVGMNGGSNGQSSQVVPRYFKLDKPYWVIMKQADSQNPFFILGINNTELMERSN